MIGTPNADSKDERVRRLVSDFLAKMPGPKSDTHASGIDSKHQKILREASDSLPELNYRNLRNWGLQSDMGAPAQFFRESGVFKGILKPFYSKVFRHSRERKIIQGFLDDLSVLRDIGAEGLLRENPIKDTPSASGYFDHEGISASFRWLRYIYLAHRILKIQVLDGSGVWVDIGSYYGGLQGIIYGYSSRARFVLIDFNHQLCRSYIYLSMLFPNANHFLLDKIQPDRPFSDYPEGSLIYIPASEFPRFSEQSADLVTNFFSFGEMRRDTFLSYYNSNLLRRSKTLYLVNRFVSAPFFEPTYDTDLTILDYLDEHRKKIYFDVYPIHHYTLNERVLWGRKAYRNASSSYFEYIAALAT